ncbi:MAG: hypothetical protein JXB38_06580 [Anaerolineales bacterium]|nr:hypothetical protein [Anaerolineales bacterium]
MLAPQDPLTIPYTPDLTQAGIAYVQHNLHYIGGQYGGTRPQRLQGIVTEKIVELAFRRHLTTAQIPHELVETPSFAAGSDVGVTLGGRRCELISYLFAEREIIRAVGADPRQLLQAEALVPKEQLVSERLADEDVYLFAFLLGLVADDESERQKAQQANLPMHLIKPCPKDWARPAHWHSLGTLVLKSDTSAPIKLTLSGQDADRHLLSEEIMLQPLERAEATNGFYSLTHLYAAAEPNGPVGVHSPVLGETLLVEAGDWQNLWVYGMRIILAGYMTRGEFRRMARVLPPGSSTMPFSHTAQAYLTVPVHALHPLADLFARAQY